MSGQVPILQLYRRILKAAQHFPSRKKDGIIAGIKQEFRDKRALTDAKELSRCRAVAERGLSDLEAYVPAKGAEGDVSISLKGATS